MKIKNFSLYLVILMFLPVVNSLADSEVGVMDLSHSLNWSNIRLVCADPSQPNDPIVASFPAPDLSPNAPNTYLWYGSQISHACSGKNMTIQATSSSGQFVQCPSFKNLNTSTYYNVSFGLGNQGDPTSTLCTQF